MKIIFIYLLLAMTSVSCGSTEAKVKAAKKPNVVVILADDLGYGDLGCYNAESKIQTPHLDSLAGEGMLFSDAHSNSAVCTPTRYGIITGRYCWRSRLKAWVLMGYSPALIEPERETIASWLKKRDYDTACIGKWHMGMNFKRQGKKGWDYSAGFEQGPTERGFDHFFGISASLDMPPYCYLQGNKVEQLPLLKSKAGKYPRYQRGGDIAKDFSIDEAPMRIVAEAKKYIRSRSADKPFFLYLALPSPHKPVVPAKQFRGKSGIGEYGDYVMQTDWSAGQVIKALKEKGLFENTLVIFTSDNGSFAIPEKYGVVQSGHAPNGNLRGQKTDVYEGGHRVPFIASWPARIKAGTKANATICTTDIFATCADALGEKTASAVAEDSYSLLPLLEQKNFERAAVIHHSGAGMFAIRKGEWKLIVGKGSGGRTKVAKDSPKLQLYNMNLDPAEKDNLYLQKPEIVKQLMAELELIKSGKPTEVKTVKSSKTTPDGKITYKKIKGINLKLEQFNPPGYEPGKDKRPAIVFFFGGGWVGGSPAQFYAQARHFANLGFVCFCAEYRISKKHKSTPFDSVCDAKSAVRYIRQHAKALGIDPQKIVASGGSAGGHLATSTAVIKDFEQAGEKLTISSMPNAVMAFNPVLDTTEKGYGMSKVGEARKTELSPCHNVGSDLPPMLIMTGTADTTTPFENAQRFTRLMLAAGNRCELKAFDGRNHGFFNGKQFRKSSDNKDFSMTMKQCEEFVKKLGF